MKTIELKVDGLCCSDCAIKVENVLKATRGVTDIKTLITSEKAVITYDEADVNTDEIIKKIEGIGHKAQIISNFKFQIICALCPIPSIFLIISSVLTSASS